MTVRGHVQNGVVVLDDPTALPDGAEVSVRALSARGRSGRTTGEHGRPARKRLTGIVGIVKDAPPDLAENHDHYLYGSPKRS